MNVLIVHYNTPKLTECLVKSINKYVGTNCTIYIFDNSNKLPFTYRQDNLVYLDNTHGNILNFTEELSKYPEHLTNRSKDNGYASAKHCMSIQKCFELIPDGFVLLDSDVLIVKDFSEIVDETVVYSGMIEKQFPSTRRFKMRLCPYMCYINVKKCKELGINYFNPKKMLGIVKNATPENGYDTGAWFYEASNKYKHIDVKIHNYILHYGNASFGKKTEIQAKSWLMINKKHWEGGEYKAKTNINILIIHYNTPKLTECLIKSINKYVDTNCTIYIFDSSDKEPFTYRQSNLVILDNTKGQIVDFDKELEKYPKRIDAEASGKHISFRHCISVDKCFDLINDNFILMDSDTLLKRNIKDLWDNDCFYSGESGRTEPVFVEELIPYLCFINVKKCKEFGIRYFDKNKMHGLHKGEPGNRYDTGGAFFEKVKDKPHKGIVLDDYIVHYKGGSWSSMPNWSKINSRYHGNMTSDSWLMINKKYWENGEYVMNKKVVYTCITGGYDNLMEPKFITPGFDYVCFTDDVENTQSKVWQIRPIPDELYNLSNVKKQRMVKINPHKYLSEYDESIWVDGSMMVIGDLNKFIDEYCRDKSISVLFREHPARKCIYDEAETCLRMKKDTPENIKSQMDRYRKEGFPRKYGLVESNMIYRRHNNPYCIKLMETWAEEVRKGSHRDQLSFNYALWKVGAEGYKCTKINVRGGLYFKWLIRHNPKHQILKRVITPENPLVEQECETVKPVPSPMKVISNIHRIRTNRISKSAVYQSRSKLGMYF